MRSGQGALAVGAIGLVLGVLAVTQFRVQDVREQTLETETPASLTALIANLSEKNSLLREEIFDLQTRIAASQDAIARGSITEAERQLAQLRTITGQAAVQGPGVAVTIDGPFDERALVDLVNELRNSGAEAIAVNDVRVGPRTWFGAGASGALSVGGASVNPPWTVRAVGAPDVMHVALTRTGGIVPQFGLIYPRTQFRVTKEQSLQLPAVTANR
jgi:uncharacterized protein YlxW (UPF0749 family)